MEGMKKGGIAVVLVGEKIGAAEVVAKVEVQAADVLRPGGVGVRLRLEVNGDGSVTGMFQKRGSPCMRLVGRAAGYTHLCRGPRGQVRVGIGARGGTKTLSVLQKFGGKYAVFQKFRGHLHAAG